MALTQAGASLGSGLHVTSRDGDKPSKQKTSLLTVRKLLQATLLEANELQPLVTNTFISKSHLRDVLCKDSTSCGV